MWMSDFGLYRKILAQDEKLQTAEIAITTKLFGYHNVGFQRDIFPI